MSRNPDLERALVPNRRLTIYHGGQYYPTRVESVEGSEFAVAAPLEGPVPAPIYPGETVEVRLENEQGLLRFQARVHARRLQGIPLLVIGWPDYYERRQRREYARVPVRVRARLVFPPTGEATAEQQYAAYTTDLGGGGMHVMLPLHPAHTVAEGEEVTIVLELPDGEGPVPVGGCVVRVRPGPPIQGEKADGPVLEIGIEFQRLHERDRNRICRQINHRQIELRQKGLL